MTQQDDRRRPPLYWFQHKRGEYTPLPFPSLSGVHPFCFFRSREYAREFLYKAAPSSGRRSIERVTHLCTSSYYTTKEAEAP